MTEIIFKDLKIQTGFRVKIPKSIIDTLNLEVGKKIILKFDAENRIIKIEEEKDKAKEKVKDKK
jgi:antitoxin component of MazEF toxin-antitoxin module